MRAHLLSLLLILPSVVLADPSGTPQAKRLTGDGVELPVTASYRWYGDQVKLPLWGDPLGKTPEEVFGSAAAVYTLEKSKAVAEGLLGAADKRALTLPYFVKDKWGAEYVGFSLFEGRIYRLEVRFKAPTAEQVEAVNKAFAAAKLGPKSQLATKGYAAEVPGNWAAGQGAVFRLDPTWKYLFPQEFTFAPGMEMRDVMNGTQTNRKWLHKDAGGDYYILDQPNPTERADDPETPHVDKYKVYVKDDKAVSLEEIETP